MDCSGLAKKEFIKMQGTGNNFLLVRHYGQSHLELQDLSKRLCDYNFGIGADGILVIMDAGPDCGGARYHMRIYNRDGSMAEMCGNGLRCFSACLVEMGMEKAESFEVVTDDGVKKVKVVKQTQGYNITVQMGTTQCLKEIKDLQQEVASMIPSLQFSSAQYLLFNVPHLIIKTNVTPTKEQSIAWGKALQARINANINFVQNGKKQEDKAFRIKIRTFERGAGLTLACGTGSCAASLVCRLKEDVQGPIEVKSQGGTMRVYVDGDKVMMEGPAAFICRGIYY